MYLDSVKDFYFSEVGTSVMTCQTITRANFILTRDKYLKNDRCILDERASFVERIPALCWALQQYNKIKGGVNSWINTHM